MVVTSEMVGVWCKAARTNASLYAMQQLVGAVHREGCYPGASPSSLTSSPHCLHCM